MTNFTRTFRDQAYGDTYRIRFEWHGSTLNFIGIGKGYYCLYVEERPACTYELGERAHLRPGDQICVKSPFEPRTANRAKAIAMLWLRGFSIYCRTGAFPNDGGKVNVAEE